MADRGDMIMPMLRQMRAENVHLHAETQQRMDSRFAKVERRLDKLERIGVAERKVCELENLK